jgi:predicted permease
MLRLFAENLLPVFLAAGAGYVVAWRWKVDPRPMARVAFNVFAPCLVLQAIVDSDLPGADLLRMAGLALTVLLSTAAAAALIAHWLGWRRTLIAAIVLVVLLPNAGNFGLSVALFAFGDAGLAQASVFFVMSAVMTFTLGVFVASMGRASLLEAVKGLLSVPAIWGVAVAILVTTTEWSLPLPLARTVGLFSQASIPTFLVILGMQLHGNGWRAPFRPLALAVGTRLLLSPLIALLFVSALGLEGAARQAGVLQTAMPSAIITIVLATEYDVEPTFVTSAVFVTTLLTPLSVTPLLAYLGA